MAQCRYCGGLLGETCLDPEGCAAKNRPQILIVDVPPPSGDGAYAEGHRQGYEDGFKQAAAILEVERDGWKKDASAHAVACADAMSHCWQRMNSFLAGRQRRGAR